MAAPKDFWEKLQSASGLLTGLLIFAATYMLSDRVKMAMDQRRFQFENVKEMRDLGFENLTVNQLIQMRIHGVDADYVKKMRAAGLKNVSVNQMIEMRATGIDAILLKEKVKEKR